MRKWHPPLTDAQREDDLTRIFTRALEGGDTALSNPELFKHVLRALADLKSFRHAEGRFTIQLREGEDGWIVAECLELPGCYSQGKTTLSAISNISDAIISVLTVKVGQP
jgi:predicted RNase H-like HicB family nuclease